jgi:hypothetical protein
VDHEFKAEGTLTPFGIFRPQTSESALFFTDGKVTSDFIADCLEHWIEERAETLKDIRKLVVDLDNGPENSGQRNQWLLRMVLLAQRWVCGAGLLPAVPQQVPSDRAAGGYLGELCWSRSISSYFQSRWGRARSRPAAD